MNNKNLLTKKRQGIIIGVISLMVCIIGATYAYFALTASNDNTVTGTVGSSTLELTVSKLFPNSEATMIPQMENALHLAISEEHNCIDNYGNIICQVYEATIKNVNSNTKLKGTIKFSDIDNIENLKWKRITDSRTIGEYPTKDATTTESLFEEEREFTPNETAKYYFVMWIDETGIIQRDEGTFKATIKFSTIDGGLTSTVTSDDNTTTAAQHIIDLYNTGEESDYQEVRIADNPDKQLVKLNTKQKIMMVDQGPDYGVEYRYYGSSPNNYVEFNGELWRIISSGTVYSSEEDTTGSQRLRIIKDTSIGEYAWNEPDWYWDDGLEEWTYNDDPLNDWTDSTLMCQLNTKYFNDIIEICGDKIYMKNITISLNENSSNLIDKALWYLGGGSGFEGLYANDYYTFERNGFGGNEVHPTRWIGTIGIMYPSDYTYATDLSFCKVTGYNYNDSNCVEKNWLFNNDFEWTIMPYEGDPYIAFLIDEEGVIYSVDDDFWNAVNVDLEIRPVTVLKSNVTITGGEGTSGSPYQLALSE